LLLAACGGGENEKRESASEEMAESNTDIEAGALEESESEELSGELRIMTWEGFDIVEPSLVNMEKCVGQGIITHEMEGKTVLMITHHYHQLEGFDRIFYLKDGKLREQEQEK
jgi:hypothetical protein